MNQTDLFGGRGIAQSGRFMRDAYLAILRLPAGSYTGERIRLELSRQGIIPHHHNAWGALIRRCVAEGVLKRTGRYEAMRTRKSHARRTPVYSR